MDKVDCYIAPINRSPMRGVDLLGRQRHWILEIHLIDDKLSVGGFYEQLLTLQLTPSDPSEPLLDVRHDVLIAIATTPLPPVLTAIPTYS